MTGGVYIPSFLPFAAKTLLESAGCAVQEVSTGSAVAPPVSELGGGSVVMLYTLHQLIIVNASLAQHPGALTLKPNDAHIYLRSTSGPIPWATIYAFAGIGTSQSKIALFDPKYPS